MLFNHIKTVFHRPFMMLAIMGVISSMALAAALFSEVALGLEPCILCIYQRIPYAVVIVLALTALFLRRRPSAVHALLTLSGLAFLINSAIAFYHTGVEQRWWASAVEGCAVPGFGEDPQSILENILSAPTARCDEIPWVDPILGLSMANYNIVVCLGLSLICFWVACHTRIQNKKADI